MAAGRPAASPAPAAGEYRVPAGTIARYGTLVPLHLAGHFSARSEHDHGVEWAVV